MAALSSIADLASAYVTLLDDLGLRDVTVASNEQPSRLTPTTSRRGMTIFPAAMTDVWP